VISETVLPLVIPQHSHIISIVIESQSDNAGTVTLQTTPIDDEDARRIIFIDYITGAGFCTGNSAKEYFTHKQNLVVKITGSIEVIVNIIFWEVNK
jgi:hypothetical protein